MFWNLGSGRFRIPTMCTSKSGTIFKQNGARYNKTQIDIIFIEKINKNPLPNISLLIDAVFGVLIGSYRVIEGAYSYVSDISSLRFEFLCQATRFLSEIRHLTRLFTKLVGSISSLVECGCSFPIQVLQSALWRINLFIFKVDLYSYYSRLEIFQWKWNNTKCRRRRPISSFDG